MLYKLIIYDVLFLFSLNICFSINIFGNSFNNTRIPRSLSISFNKSQNILGFIPFKNLFSTNMTSTRLKPLTIGLDPFCFKQFERKSVNFIPYPKDMFLEKVRECLRNGSHLRDGYAPFCKHLFVRNFTEATSGSIQINPENEHLLKSGYLARTPQELPVLTRWFNKSDVTRFISRARYLDVILYSKEQVIKEHEAMNTREGLTFDHDYYVISIKPQDVDHELPMLPITIMRNALITEGGSGVAIDRDKYKKAVQYWSKHAVLLED